MGLQDSFTRFTGFLHLVYSILTLGLQIIILAIQDSYCVFTEFLYWVSVFLHLVYRILTLGLHDSDIGYT